MKKCYDISPASDGSHNLNENGIAIARYSDLATAERVRDQLVKDLARDEYLNKWEARV